MHNGNRVNSSSGSAFCRNSNGLRTTSKPQKAYWVLEGDANGAMYGGLQIAENIQFNKFEGTYNNEESPAILKK